MNGVSCMSNPIYELEDEVLDLKSKVSEYETLINAMRNKLSMQNSLLEDLQKEALNTQVVSKQPRSLSRNAKLKWEHYHKHKRDKEIMDKFADCAKHGKVPWQWIKRETDLMFAKLGEN
jgi:hypothetical protein